MTCRHSPGDRSCSSYSSYSEPEPPKTPDSEKYEIVDAVRIGKHLVLKVKYPNCSNCSYEGQKVMVYLNVTEIEVLKWKRIDPHFKEPSRTKLATSAPAPVARFPASAEGWADAQAYARGKN